MARTFFFIFSDPYRLLMRRAQFAGWGIPRYTEHRTVLPAPNRVSDRCGRTLNWVSEAPFGVLTREMPIDSLEVVRGF